MICRTQKHKLRKKLRNIKFSNKQRPRNISDKEWEQNQIKTVIIKYFNKIFGNKEKSNDYWRNIIKVDLFIHFEFNLDEIEAKKGSEVENIKNIDYRLFIVKIALFHNLSSKLGLIFNNDIIIKLQLNSSLFENRNPFEISNLNSIYPISNFPIKLNKLHKNGIDFIYQVYSRASIPAVLSHAQQLFDYYVDFKLNKNLNFTEFQNIFEEFQENLLNIVDTPIPVEIIIFYHFIHGILIQVNPTPAENSSTESYKFLKIAEFLLISSFGECHACKVGYGHPFNLLISNEMATNRFQIKHHQETEECLLAYSKTINCFPMPLSVQTKWFGSDPLFLSKSNVTEDQSTNWTKICKFFPLPYLNL